MWEPDGAIAPGEGGYAQRQDRLGLRGDDASITVLQTFARGETAVDPNTALEKAIDDWIGGRSLERVTLMVHGFAFDPSRQIGGASDDPYELVYAVPDANPSAVTHNWRLSWLPIVGETDNQGVDSGRNAAIAFAWVSEGSFSQYANAGWNNPYLYAAFDLAPLAAKALAAVIAALKRRGQKFDILAHSLGTRATSQAIGMLRPNWEKGWLRRAVLVGGAEYCVDANANLLGLDFDVFSLGNTDDSVLTWLAHSFSHPVRQYGSDADRVIGCDGVKRDANWLDIQVNRQDVRQWISARYGATVTGDANPADETYHSNVTMNHWVYYMDPGNRQFIATLLGNGIASLADFTQNGFPAGIDVGFYGNFNPDIPPTPTTMKDRIALWSGGTPNI